MGINYAAYRVRRNAQLATHVILAIGTLVVVSLFATGGWDGSGYLWPFAYLPYAFFLARPRVAQVWVGILFAACIGVALAAAAALIPIPYSGIQISNFFAALGIFSACMFLLQHAVVKYERLARVRADEIATQAANELATTERMEQLQEMNRFRAQFLNTAAHELATPLTPIKLQVHLLQEQASTSMTPEMHRSVEMLGRNVDRLQTLVQDLLNAARLQANAMTMRIQPIDLAQVIDEAVETYAEPCRKAGIALRVTHLPHLPLDADPIRLSQVLFNLLSNAVKFTPAGGMIHVEARATEGAALVTVTDTGTGMRPDQIERLFQPFAQVHDTSNSSAPGNGLGLYISKSIVELHGGTMWCSSLGAGRGSAFTFQLPLHATVHPNPTLQSLPLFGWPRNAPRPRV